MKSALITGAASGIGKACAQRMAKEGYGVVVADVNMPAAEELVKELTAQGLSAIAVHMDVSSEEEVEAGFDKMVDTCIRRHYRNVAMVVHGGTIMSILEQYGVPQKSYYDWRVENGCGYHLYLSEQNWKMGRREAVVESEIRR